MALESKKLKAELLRVQAAKAEMEYIIEQRMEEIARLQDAMKKQDETACQIELKMKDMESK